MVLSRLKVKFTLAQANRRTLRMVGVGRTGRCEPGVTRRRGLGGRFEVTAGQWGTEGGGLVCWQ